MPDVLDLSLEHELRPVAEVAAGVRMSRRAAYDECKRMRSAGLTHGIEGHASRVSPMSASVRTPRRLVLAAAACVVASGAAQAQSAKATVSVAASEATLSTRPPQPPPPGSEDAKFQAFDALAEKGWIVAVPTTTDSVVADTGGVRSALAAYGIGFLGLGSYSYFGDLLKQNGGVQYYNGQKPTFGTSTNLSANLNLDQYGIPHAQITATGVLLTTSWKPFGPPAFSLLRLNYYQSFLDGRVEAKVGYIVNHVEFFGTQVGGNIISGTLGPSANLLYQNGLTRTPLTAPGANVRFNGPNHLYWKSGIQRSTSPAGPQAEADANPTGFRFRTPNAHALFINEIGYKRPASLDERSIWIRGGVLYNNSPYTIFGTTRTSSNHAFAFLADAQIVKTNPLFPARGVYGGITALKGDPNVDGTDQYYEARLYGVGIVPGRAKDFVSLVYTHSEFSRRNQALVLAQGIPSVAAINNLTASYSAHVVRGVFLNLGITYGDHASITPITRPTLVFASALSVVY